jgi:hypothetical protein
MLEKIKDPTYEGDMTYDKKQGLYEVAYDSKWACIRDCFWQNRLWKTGETWVMQEGSQIPHHFECLTPPPVKKQVAAAIHSSAGESSLADEIRRARSWKMLEALSEENSLALNKDLAFDDAKSALLANLEE